MGDSHLQNVFFLDDDLIERLMRGDTVADAKKPRRAAQSGALVKAVELASTQVHAFKDGFREHDSAQIGPFEGFPSLDLLDHVVWLQTRHVRAISFLYR